MPYFERGKLGKIRALFGKLLAFLTKRRKFYRKRPILRHGAMLSGREMKGDSAPHRNSSHKL